MYVLNKKKKEVKIQKLRNKITKNNSQLYKIS